MDLINNKKIIKFKKKPFDLLMTLLYIFASFLDVIIFYKGMFNWKSSTGTFIGVMKTFVLIIFVYLILFYSLKNNITYVKITRNKIYICSKPIYIIEINMDEISRIEKIISKKKSPIYKLYIGDKKRAYNIILDKVSEKDKRYLINYFSDLSKNKSIVIDAPHMFANK